MKFHLFSSASLAEELTSHKVEASDQAAYLAASFIAWLLPYYSFLYPLPYDENEKWYWSMWAYEAFMLVIINIFGVLKCLNACEFEPKKNFLVDFSCLYLPVSVTTLIGVWSVYYLYRYLWVLLVQSIDPAIGPPEWAPIVFSYKFHDLLRLLAVVAVPLIIFLRIGAWMRIISAKRALTA